MTREWRGRKERYRWRRSKWKEIEKASEAGKNDKGVEREEREMLVWKGQREFINNKLLHPTWTKRLSRVTPKLNGEDGLVT